MFSACYYVLTLQISCMESGRVVLCTEYERTHPPALPIDQWLWLSFDTHWSILDASDKCFKRSSFYTWESSLFLRGKTAEWICCQLQKKREKKSGDAWFSFFTCVVLISLSLCPHSLLVCLTADDSSMGDTLQSETHKSHWERRWSYNVGQAGRADDTFSWYTKVSF